MTRTTIKIENKSHQDPAKYRIDFKKADRVFNHSCKANPELPVIERSSKFVILGSGFSGIASAIKLLDLKQTDFVIYEKHADFGGTWYANTYPGCASDVPAMWYSLSSVLNRSWSSIQPPQYEIEEYIQGVVEKFGIRKYAHFGQAIQKVVYDDKTATWTITIVDVNTGQVTRHTSHIVLSNTGGLVQPLHLNLPGLQDFKGKYMHSAVYDHSVSLKGKVVAVVGSGCSACQIVPALLKDYGPKQVIQVARSKQYIMPPITRILQLFYRLFSFSYYLLKLLRQLVVFVAELRFPLYKGEGWVAQLVRWLNTRTSLAYMNRICPEKFKDAIIPDYKIGCKRLVFDNKYLQSLHDDRVDVKAAGIERVVEDGLILTTGEKIKADVIIACTGYDIPKSARPYELIGSGGFNISNHWKENAPSAYRTCMIRNAPNFFLIGGPNIATGHSSFVQSCENVLKYIERVAKPVIEGKKKSVVVKSQVYEDWFNMVQREMRNTVYGSEFGGCSTWYTKEGYNYTTYPFSQVEFWWRCVWPNYKDLLYEDNDKKDS